MPSTLAQLETRVAALLFDPALAVWTTAVIDESIRQALHEYQQVVPLTAEALLTLPGVGRTIALNEVTGLLNITRIWWPATPQDDDTNKTPTSSPANLRFDDNQPWSKSPPSTSPNSTILACGTQNSTPSRTRQRCRHTPCPPITAHPRPSAAAYACFSRAADLNETSA